MTTPLETFIEALRTSLQEATFIKLTLSKSAPKSAELTHIYIRRIDLKGQVYLSFTYRYTTKDIVKNYLVDAAIEELERFLGKSFLAATLLTTQQDVALLYNKKRKARLQYRQPSSKTVPTSAHNKVKNYLIEEDAPFLEKLGIASNGKVHKAHRDKYRQINKYVEIMDGLIQQAALPTQPHIVDMGCGKGYLTFALYQHWLQDYQQPLSMVGIELREHLTTFCNEKAQALGWNDLQFIAQDIFDYNDQKIDILIALHACDIATDIAIAKGIQAGSPLIVTAPCCHKQIRKAMTYGNNPLSDILKHGILEERQAELITDGIRALYLEAYGYKTKVFEFIALEHTAKNVMITASKVASGDATLPNPVILEKIKSIKAQFGIQEHYLERLLPLQEA